MIGAIPKGTQPIGLHGKMGTAASVTSGRSSRTQATFAKPQFSPRRGRFRWPYRILIFFEDDATLPTPTCGVLNMSVLNYLSICVIFCYSRQPSAKGLWI